MRYTFVFFFVAVACLDQYDPRPQWEKFSAERELAHRTIPTLSDDGTLPRPAQKLSPEELGTQRYALYCASCHGDAGAGDGVGGKSLEVVPRDFRDEEWQTKTTDERIAEVISKGGTATGLNTAMAAYGAILTDEEITALVGKIRKFAE